MFLGREGAQRRLASEARMAATGDADVALDPKRLAADLLGQRRERTHGEVELAQLEPGFEMLCLELQHPQPHFGGFLQQPVDQRRQKLDQAGVDHAEIERAVRRSRVERDVLAAQRLHSLEDRPHRRLQLQRLRRRLHPQRHAHEQRILEIAAQARQRLAQGRLGHVERARRPRQTVLAQQHVENLQVMQVGFAFIARRNSGHIVRFIV